MPVISLFSGLNYNDLSTGAESVQRELVNTLGLPPLLETDVLEQTSRWFNVPVKKRKPTQRHTMQKCCAGN
ncbi:hypothetical protein [Candidatus Magnetobacterium casense]|uniref:Uncharacterized protein n=1 Tax=Candidatus Magnetobacterium casense TaxID=1455061 RepID=A0ABS6RZC4_9BACT|nr:hypothetical protein [Candidatus Magnetobacterium casensis]MBV6342004.1 hypothetical protein [Candidatus Magnetobacterium casensis]